METTKKVLTIIAIALIISPVLWGAWDKTKPAAGTSLQSSNPEILANWAALDTSIDAEHDFDTGSHTPGSARAFFQDAAPSTQIDGGSFAATDLGSLWFDTNSSIDNTFYVLTATTPTWTAVNTEIMATLLASARVFAGTLGVTGDLAVNTDKFTVTATSGNTLVAGTFDSTGIATLGDGSLLKTSAAPSTDAMISNKKYVDDQCDAHIGTSGQYHNSGTQVYGSSAADAPSTWTDLDLSAVVGSNYAMVFLKIIDTEGGNTFRVRPNGDTSDSADGSQSSSAGYGASAGYNGATGRAVYLIGTTDSSGVIEWDAYTAARDTDVWVVGYVI